MLLNVQQGPWFWPGLLRVNLNDFPPLSEPLSSVRIGTYPIGSNQETSAWLKPIVINRGQRDDFYVVSAVCTHQGCIVRRMDRTSRLMVCPCHGSQFEIDGEVRPNQPAGSALDRFNFTREGSILNISVPDIFFDVTFERVPSSSRVQIKFVAFYQTKYEIYFRSKLNGPAQLVNFALTEDGPLDQQEIEGVEDSLYTALFLERPGAFGFFQVAMKTAEV